MVVEVAEGTCRRRNAADTMEISAKMRAVARTKAIKDNLIFPWQSFERRVDRRRLSLKDGIITGSGDGFIDVGSVKSFFDVTVFTGRQDVVD